MSAADVLPAASILLAVGALLSNAWRADVKKAVDDTRAIPDFGRQGLQRQVDRALRQQAWPLTGMLAALVVVLAPAVVGVLVDTLGAVGRGRWNYDVRAACLVVVFVGLCLLTAAAVRDLRSLRDAARRLREAPKARS